MNPAKLNVFWASYRTSYNGLRDVDGVYARLLKRRGYIKVIRTALRIIKDHGANSFLGVFLLHRHFQCEPRTLFVERRYTPQVVGHRTVLVTAPSHISNAPRRLAPHRLRIDPSGVLQPLEFTTDQRAIAYYDRLMTATDLRRDLGRYFSRYRFTSLLGIGIFARIGSIPMAPRVFLEETRFDERASVMHVLPHLPRVAGRLIPTLWTFGQKGNGCCTQNCIAYCSHPTGGKIGYCGHKSTGHVGCA